MCVFIPRACIKTSRIGNINPRVLLCRGQGSEIDEMTLDQWPLLSLRLAVMKMVSRRIRPLRSSGKNRKSSPTQNCPVFQLLQSAGAHNACLLNAFRVTAGGKAAKVVQAAYGSFKAATIWSGAETCLRFGQSVKTPP